MPAFDIPANLAFDTFDKLVSGINDWLDRDDLTGPVPQQMIALAEAEIRRRLQPYFTEKSTSIAVTNGYGELPSDYGILRRVSLGGWPLSQVSAFTVEDGGCIPVGYSIEDKGLRIWPQGDYVVAVLYQPFLPALSSTTQSTDLLQQHPDLYFYGALVLSGAYLSDENAKSTYGTLFNAAMASAQEYLMRQRYAGPLVPRLGFRVP